MLSLSLLPWSLWKHLNDRERIPLVQLQWCLEDLFVKFSSSKNPTKPAGARKKISSSYRKFLLFSHYLFKPLIKVTFLSRNGGQQAISLCIITPSHNSHSCGHSHFLSKDCILSRAGLQ